MKNKERWIVYPTLAVLAASMLLRLPTAGADAPPDGSFGVLTAREIRIVDDKGTNLIQLYATANGGAMTTADLAGKELAYIGASTESAGLVYVRRAGVQMMAVTSGTAGGAALAYNPDGKNIAYFGATADAAGLVYAATKEGVRGVELATTAAGGGVTAYNVPGKQVAYLGTVADGSGQAYIAGKEGVKAVQLTAGTAGGYASAYNAQNGKEIAYFGASAAGLGLLSLTRADGERRAYVNGGGFVGVLKDNGKDGALLTTDAKGGLLRVFNANEKPVDLPSGR